MAVRTPLLSSVSIIFLAGGILLDLFIVLSGYIYATPFGKTFFLQANTNGLFGGKVPNPARWTYLAICSEAGGKNANCGPIHAAIPFDPRNNFNGPVLDNGFPLSHHSSYYYYMSRVAWAFYIIALFFAVVAFFMSITALCSRLAAKLTGLMTIIAVVMQAIAASLMTAWTVKAQHVFKSNGHNASLGKYAYGFTWAALACFILSSVLFCVGGTGGKDNTYQSSSYFGRKRSTRSSRSRGSFRDSESGKRVKDEYE